MAYSCLSPRANQPRSPKSLPNRSRRREILSIPIPLSQCSRRFFRLGDDAPRDGRRLHRELPFALWHESRKRLWASPGGPQSTNAPYILQNPALKGPQSSGVYHYQGAQTATAITPPSDAVAHNSERENMFLKTCTATFITEFFLCFIGVSVYFLPATANASLYQPDPMVNRFTCLFHVDSMYAEKNTHTSQPH